MKKTTALASIAVLILVSSALAACSSPPKRDARKDGEPRRPRVSSGLVARPINVVFAAMDVDRDTIITGEEAVEGINAEWKRADANQDGQATPIEISKWAKATLGDANALPNWISFDTDLNSSVSEREFSERLRQDFARLDRDKNGVITRTEIFSQIGGNRQARGNSQGRNGQGGGQRRQGGGRRGPPRN